MMAIFHDMIEKTMEVLMDDFSIFGNSFQSCLSHLQRMLKRCEDTNLCLNWEKGHFIVKEGIVKGLRLTRPKWMSLPNYLTQQLSREDFVYQVEHKDAKKSNEMYYPRFTKVIIHYFMTKDPSIPRRNKVNWHYVRDDQMFTMIKLVLRHQNIQQFGVMLPVELTNKEIRNSEAYKEYYAVAPGAAPPKTKASVRKKKSTFDTTITPPTAAGTRLLTSAKGRQPAKASKAKNKGTGIIPGVLDVPIEESDEEISWKSSDEDDDDDDVNESSDDQDIDNEGDEFVHPKLSIHEEEETKDEESFDPIAKTPKNSNDEGNDDACLGLNVGSEEGQDVEDDDDELYRDVNINLGRDVQMTDVHTT
nr:reverse transcriptase domain-containing protein [Tanacetum cinerariifolium]